MQLGCSTSEGKKEIKKFLASTLQYGAKILDVGAGGGTYRTLLGPFYYWDAVEVWPNAAIYLAQFYNVVYFYGNEAEIHRRTGMTPEIFNERYPGFTLVLDYKVHAYYYWSIKNNE